MEDCDNNMGVQLEVEDNTFKLVWKDNAGGYLRGVRTCGTLTTSQGERKRKKEMKKLATTTSSIVDMFLAQSNKNQASDIGISPTIPLAVAFSQKTMGKKADKNET